MRKIIRNILAVLTGAILGSVINMGIIMISNSIIPPPDGIDTSNMESLKENMHLFQPKHYIMPFLAHAIGTLIGAFIAALIAGSHKMTFALVIGIFFLIGGIMAVFMLPSPVWFSILDLLLAYIPMAWIGGKVAISFAKPQ